MWNVDCKCSVCKKLCRCLPCSSCHDPSSAYQESVPSQNVTYEANGITYMCDNVTPSAGGSSSKVQISSHCIENPAYIDEFNETNTVPEQVTSHCQPHDNNEGVDINPACCPITPSINEAPLTGGDETKLDQSWIFCVDRIHMQLLSIKSTILYKICVQFSCERAQLSCENCSNMFYGYMYMIWWCKHATREVSWLRFDDNNQSGLHLSVKSICFSCLQFMGNHFFYNFMRFAIYQLQFTRIIII
jgi:hypothetical protein